MGELSGLSGQDVCKILGKHGFAEVRRRSSHVVMQKKTGEKTITVIVPDYKEIKK